MRRITIYLKRTWRRTALRRWLLRYDHAIRSVSFWLGLVTVAYISIARRDIWSREVLPWEIYSSTLGVTALFALFAARVSHAARRGVLVKPLIWVSISLILIGYGVYDLQFPPLTWAWLVFCISLSWLFYRLAGRYAVKFQEPVGVRATWMRPTISVWEMLERRGMPPLPAEWRELLQEWRHDVGELLLALKLRGQRKP